MKRNAPKKTGILQLQLDNGYIFNNVLLIIKVSNLSNWGYQYPPHDNLERLPKIVLHCQQFLASDGLTINIKNV